MSQPDPPSVSIIVPTYNRAVTLADTLRSLTAQLYPPDKLEILVVDNSSTDGTEEVVDSVRAVSPVPVRYFRKDNRGPAASRNFGIVRARGEVVGFTDSDCSMAPDWIRNAVRRLEPGVGLLYGPVCPVVNPTRVPSFFYHQTDHRRPNAIYPTANVFYRREVLDSLGGFDEAFGAYPWGTPLGGEDIDLAWRVKHAGYRDVWVPDAPVYHEASEVGARVWLIEPIKAQSMPRLVARIPELRRDLVAGLFVSLETLTFYPALIGLLIALITRRRAPALLLAIPWLWRVHPMIDRDVWPPFRWWRIPLKYGLMLERYLLMASALVYASVRARTVVL